MFYTLIWRLKIAYSQFPKPPKSTHFPVLGLIHIPTPSTLTLYIKLMRPILFKRKLVSKYAISQFSNIVYKFSPSFFIVLFDHHFNKTLNPYFPSNAESPKWNIDVNPLSISCCNAQPYLGFGKHWCYPSPWY